MNHDDVSVHSYNFLIIARLLIIHIQVLILDEATAAVDLETDDLIQATIRKEFAGSSVLTIAHRLNTIMDYDRIMVLDKGELREFDKPHELLKVIFIKGLQTGTSLITFSYFTEF